MHYLCSTVLVLNLGSAFAQVSMGHLHLSVRDLDAGRKFWVDGLGGVAAPKLGNNDVYKFPDVLVMLRKAEFSGATDGCVVSHLGFKVKDLQAALARARAAGIQVLSENPTTHQAFVATPEGVRVELTEEASMELPIAHHHVHFSTQAVDAMKVWYVNTFGAKAGKRGRFEAADLPGANLSFSPSQQPTTPTKGRSLDHIGFEVKNLEAFTKKLTEMGVRFDVPYRKVESLGLAIAFLTDPWGTYIELTEGLGR